MNGMWRLVRQAIQRLGKGAEGAPGAISPDLPPAPAAPLPDAGPRRVVVVTACPTGIARTYMAAEALQQAAVGMDVALRVETQGSVGSGTPLTPEEIAAADVVILAVDREVDRSRFAGCRVFASPTGPAIVDGRGLIRRALEEAQLQPQTAPSRPEATANVAGPYRHLMTGVSFMLPFVVVGGFLTALSFSLGDTGEWQALKHALRLMGDMGFALMLPALAGYMAFSIADRPGIAPGMIGGMLCTPLGAGFFGALVAGFVAGYTTRALNRALHLPPVLAGLKPVLILPLLGALVTGLVMLFLVGEPAAWLNRTIGVWLNEVQGLGSVGLGVALGSMMALDLGGPLNKAAYAFAVGVLEADVYRPMAAVMAAGMVPPLAAGLATRLFATRYTPEEREAGGVALLMGLAFVSEGAIPFAARDPLRTVPAFVVGAALAGGLTLALGVRVMVPHGGLFALLIPGAVEGVPGFLLAVGLGSVVGAGLLELFGVLCGKHTSKDS